MDPRQQRQSHSQRPPYPQVMAQATSPSTTSSVFQSTSSLASLSSINSQNQHMGAASAPLPSPSMAQPNNYFPSISSQSPTSHPAQSQRIPPQSQHADSSQYVGQRGGGGGAPETAPHLADFNLLAEAAKRAQMACLSRDLGDIGL